MEEDTMDLHNIALNDQEEGEESVSSTFDHADLSDSSSVRLSDSPLLSNGCHKRTKADMAPWEGR
jgi:hypothetical protein